MSEENVIDLFDYIEPEKQKTAGEIELQSIFGKRVISFAIDICSIAIVHASLFGAYKMFVDSHLYFLPFEKNEQLISSLELLEAPILLLVFMSYFTLSLFIYNGKTIGKKIMGISTVSQAFISEYHETDPRLSFVQAYRRSIGYVFGYISFGTLFAISYFTKGQRGVPDYMGKSQTISDRDIDRINKMKVYQESVEIEVQSLKSAA